MDISILGSNIAKYENQKIDNANSEGRIVNIEKNLRTKRLPDVIATTLVTTSKFRCLSEQIIHGFTLLYGIFLTIVLNSYPV